MRSVLKGLGDRLASSAGIEFARKRIAERLGELSREQGAERIELRKRLGRTEARLGKLVDFIAEGNASESVAAAIRDLEAQARSDRRLLAALAKHAAEPVQLPSPEEIGRRLDDMREMVRGDVLAGREAPRRMFKDGRTELAVGSDGVYVGRSELLPLMLMVEKETPPPGGPGAALSSDCSGGRI